MKKVFVLLLVLSTLATVYAGLVTTGLGSSNDAVLTLSLEPEYRFAFVEAGENGVKPTITSSTEALGSFDLKTTGNALKLTDNSTSLKLDSSKNIFYFFYQAYTTNNPQVKIEMSVPNSLKLEDSSSEIGFVATLDVVEEQWDGEDISSSISPSDSAYENTVSGSILRSGIETDFNYFGLCKVTISSEEDLGRKKPGDYSTTISLTLKTT